MFYWIIAGLSLLTFGASRVALAMSDRCVVDGRGVLHVLLVVVTGLLLVIGLGVNGVHQFVDYYMHIADQETVAAQDNLLEIYRDRQERLVEDFRATLAHEYPEHELGVLEGLEGALAVYPQLRASETVMKLVEQQRSLEDAVVEIRERRESTLRSLRVRARSPWVWVSLPEVGKMGNSDE